METCEPGNLRTWKPANLETCEPGNVRTSATANLEICERGNLRTWKLANLETSEPGNLRTWKPANLETCEPGSLRTWKLANLETCEHGNLRTHAQTCRLGESDRAERTPSLRVPLAANSGLPNIDRQNLLSQPQQQHLSEGLGLHLVLLANTQGRGCHVNFDTEVNVAYALGGSLLQGKRSKS